MSSKEEQLWTIGAVLQWTAEHFTKQGIDAPRLTAELLLAKALQRPRIYLYAHYEQPLNSQERSTYKALVLRRLGHEPLAYILGEWEFYSRKFKTTPKALIPRPETEHLVECALECLQGPLLLRQAAGEAAPPPLLVDVGTGSGIVAITLALECPQLHVLGTDISHESLYLAAENAARHQVADRIRWQQGDLLLELPAGQQACGIVANLPYIDRADSPKLAPEISQFEPASALYAPQQGYGLLFRLIEQAPAYLQAGGFLALEVGAGQAAEVAQRMAANYTVRCVPDLAGIDRIVVGVLR